MLKAYVYILYSKRLDKYYVGSTTYLPEERLKQHNEEYFSNAYTAKGIPWELYFYIKCTTKSQAQVIEEHIKRMKSRRYYENLKLYPTITEKLKQRYE